MANVVDRTDVGVGTGRAIGGVVGIFGAMGVGLGLLAIVAAYAVGSFVGVGSTGDAQTVAENDPRDAVGGISTSSIAIFTIVSIPLVALVAGVFAGLATRDSGRAAISATLGTLAGAILYVVVVGLGIAIGASAGGTGFSDVDVNVPQNIQDQMGFIGSVAGVTYLVSNLVIAAIAGAVVGATMPGWGWRAGSTVRSRADYPAGAGRDREVVEEERSPVRI